MANQSISTSQNMTAVIAAGLGDGEDININGGAILTVDSSPSVLIGDVNINEGELLVDGAAAVNPIVFVGNELHEIDNRGAGTFSTTLGWWEFPTTGDGTADQTFDASTYFTSAIVDADVFSGVWVETGRRLNYISGLGVADPKVGDWVFKTSDNDVHGRIESVSGDGVTGYIVVRFLTGELLDGEGFEIHSLQDNLGPDLQKSWFGVMNGDDVLEAGIFQEFANVRQNNVDYLGSTGSGIAGFAYSQQWQSNTLTFGDGTNGFIVPDGARVRVPMVHFCSGTVTSILTSETGWQTNEVSRYNLETGQGGSCYLNGVSLGSAYFEDQLGADFEATYCAANTGFGVYSAAHAVKYNHCVICADIQTAAVNSARNIPALTSLALGGEVNDTLVCYMFYMSGLRSLMGGFDCNGITVRRCIVISNNNFRLACNYTGCTGVDIDDFVMIGAGMVFSSTSNGEVKNFKSQSDIAGGQDTSITTNTILFQTYSSNFKITGWEILQHSAPNGNKVKITSMTNLHVRCFHFLEDKFDNDLGGAVQGEELFSIQASVCSNIRFSRCYQKNGNPTFFGYAPAGLVKELEIRNCSGGYTGEVEPGSLDSSYRGLHGGSGNFGTVSGVETDYVGATGAHFGDIFRSDTSGAIYYRNTPASELYPVSVTSGAPVFTKDGDVDVTIGDQWEVDMGYTALGHTGFTGVITTARNTSNVADGGDLWTAVDIDFQYDTGAGYNGVWLDARTPANLTGIPDFQAGIRIKLRFTAVANMTNGQGLMLHTTTTLAAQAANLHPIDQQEATLTLSGLENDTEVRIYRASDNLELAGQESVVTGEFAYTYTYSGVDVPVIIVTHALGFINQRIAGLSLTDTSTTIPIQQSVDRQYENV